MATLINWHGLGIGDGTAVTGGLAGTGDTAITGFAGGSPIVAFDSIKGNILQTPLTGANSCYIYWNTTTNTAFRSSFYFLTPSSWPGSAATLVMIFSSTSPCIKFILAGSGSPGAIRMSDSTNTNVGVSANGTVALSTWYRAELFGNLTAGTAQYKLYVNESSTAFYDSGSVASTYGSSFDNFRVGSVSTTPTWTPSVGHLTVTDDPTTTLRPFPAYAAVNFLSA